MVAKTVLRFPPPRFTFNVSTNGMPAHQCGAKAAIVAGVISVCHDTSRRQSHAKNIAPTLDPLDACSLLDWCDDAWCKRGLVYTRMCGTRYSASHHDRRTGERRIDCRQINQRRIGRDDACTHRLLSGSRA